MIITATGERRYTTKEAAAQLGRSWQAVRVAITRHDYGIWIGDQRFVSEAEIAQLANARKGRPRAPAAPRPQTTATG